MYLVPVFLAPNAVNSLQWQDLSSSVIVTSPTESITDCATQEDTSSASVGVEGNPEVVFAYVDPSRELRTPSTSTKRSFSDFDDDGDDCSSESGSESPTSKKTRH